MSTERGRPPGSEDGTHDHSVSRRTVLRTGAAAGVGVLGTTGLASADHNDASEPSRDVDGESCLEWGGDELYAGDAMILNNDWATGGDCNSENTEMCISTYDDGSFGWEWARGETCLHGEDLPNFPQALIGSKIGGTSSGWGGLPEQSGNIEQLDVELDVDQDRSDGEWNFMLEWWMDPSAGIGDPTDEILIVLEASDDHSKGEYVHEGAIEDKYGNTIHYWENEVEGGDGADWNFHIFHLDDNVPPSHLDCRAILDYLEEDPRGDVADGGGTYDGSKYVSGIEIGNETWDNTDGDTVVNQFNVRVNDQIAYAGVSDEWTEYEDEAPDAPSDLSVEAVTASSIDVDWDDVADATDYEVSVDGEVVDETGTTGYEFTGLEDDTTYEVGVAATSDAGTSETETVTATTDEEDVDPCEDAGAADGEQLDGGEWVCDVDGDGHYRDVDASGDVTSQDLSEFFQNQHRPGWDDRDDLFDFNENGNVGQPDVVELFQSL